MKRKIQSSIDGTVKVLQNISRNMAPDIEKAALSIRKSLKSGGKVIIFGNGGSAADAQHIAAEFVGRFRKDRNALPAMALTTNTSILTSIGNDYGFDSVFSRQVSAMLDKKDIVIAISTSGNSGNVIEGVKAAKQKGAFIIGMTGSGGGKMARMVGLCLRVPTDVVSHIQEAHIVIGHILCMLAEE